MLWPEDRHALERVVQIWEKLADIRKHHPELVVEPQVGSPEVQTQIAQQQF